MYVQCLATCCPYHLPFYGPGLSLFMTRCVLMMLCHACMRAARRPRQIILACHSCYCLSPVLVLSLSLHVFSSSTSLMSRRDLIVSMDSECFGGPHCLHVFVRLRLSSSSFFMWLSIFTLRKRVSTLVPVIVPVVVLELSPVLSSQVLACAFTAPLPSS